MHKSLDEFEFWQLEPTTVYGVTVQSARRLYPSRLLKVEFCMSRDYSVELAKK